MQKCGKCKRIFATDEELKNHQSKCGLNNIFLQCYFCHKPFAKESSLQNHLVAHMISNPTFPPRSGMIENWQRTINLAIHSVKKREVLSHRKNISSNQLFSKFICKIVFTKYLSNLNESKFPQFRHCAVFKIRIILLGI